MSKTEKAEGNPSGKPWLFWICLLLVAIVGYQVATGGGISELKLPGGISVKFFDGAEKPVELSEGFVNGKWQASIQFGEAKAETVTTYNSDGRYYSDSNQFYGVQGQRSSTAGNWYFRKTGDDQFELRLEGDDGSVWSGRFRVIDRNRLENLDENYIARRVN